MDPEELRRLAKRVLRELGAGDLEMTLEPAVEPDRWRLLIGGPAPMSLTIRCGRGTTAQFVRTQIFDQFQRH